MKKKNLKLKIVLLLTLFTAGHFNSLSAQDFNFIPTGYHDYYFQPKNAGIITPQSADFQRYGNLQIDHYNGLLNMEIALDGYKDKDFDLPVSIKYVSQGFMPSKRPSVVGVNWFLNFGGLITRTVKGSPDDTKGNYVSDERKYIKDGLLVAMRNGTYVQYSESVLTAFTMPMNSSYHVSGDLKYDMEPDIFHFNFGKHQGRFFIGKTGEPVSLSGNGYKIDISGLAVQSYSTTATPVSSTIKITTPDGYIYEFGGTSTYLEYTIPNNPAGTAISPRYILSWYLKSIKSPNNRQAVFTYDSRLLPNHYNYYMYSELIGASLSPVSGLLENVRGEHPQKIEIRDKVYSPIINKVTIDGAEIRFTFTTGVHFFDASDPTYHLSKTAIYYNSQLLKETDLAYVTIGKYIFLSNLTRNDEVYKFNYYPLNPPIPLTPSIDHWGFWNGGYDTDVSNIKTYCQNIEANRVSGLTGYNGGLLKNIIYPTGGRTEIVYEKNSYARYMEKNESAYGLNLRTVDENVYCGGVRVHRITDYDPVTGKSYNDRWYEYKIPGTNKGSGIINMKPQYMTTEYLWRGPSESVITMWSNVKNISSNSLGNRENYPEYHVGYSDVTEHFNDGSYIHYEYTSQANMPNSLDGLTNKITNEFYTSSSTHAVLAKIGLYITNDLSHFRGKLKKKITYNSSGDPRQTEEFFYNDASAKGTFNTSVSSTHRGFASYRTYTTPCLLMSRKVTDENNLTYTENYEYNAKHLVSRKKIANSDGLNHTMDYKYPVDYSYSSLNAATKSMVDKNMLISPMRIIKNIQQGTATATATDAIVFEYKTENGFPVTSKLKELNAETPVTETSSAFTNSLVEKESYEKYDSYGNPIHIVKDSVYNTVYLWGYKGRYPVAEIKNATYSEVKTGLGNVAPESLSSVAQPDMARINTLRSALPQASVTTYTFDPLIGITTVTDARGIVTFYIYDDSGRLREVYYYKDNVQTAANKCVVENHTYNYQQF